MTTTLSLCEVPPWILGSREFNEDPIPLVIQGAHNADRYLFERLGHTAGKEARAELFHDYMSFKFCLHHGTEETERARRSLRNSYVRLLRGWGLDSNSIEGAVLKGWVESRFGLAPTFHKEPLRRTHEEDYTPYDFDRMRGHARTNSVNDQLDLLYRYAQYELLRPDPNLRWVTLYRGTYDAHEHEVTERIDRREYYVRLNNLSSFSSDEERAWEFGTTVWKVQVPICKILFYSELLPHGILQGESEHLVIGGEYQVRELAC